MAPKYVHDCGYINITIYKCWFVTCRKRGVGLTIAHERGEQGW